MEGRERGKEWKGRRTDKEKRGTAGKVMEAEKDKNGGGGSRGD